MIEVPEIFRGYAVVRVGAVAFVLVIGAARLGTAAHPGWLVAVMAVVVVWTAFALWSYADPRRRRTWVLLADLAVTLALVLLGPWVLGPAHAGSSLSVVALWIASAPMALTLWRHWLPGLLSAVLVSLVDVLAMEIDDVRNWGGKFGFVLLTAGVGYLVTALRRSARERDAVTATAAAMSERARLARVVHDGVLQVLALVERDAPAFGPRGLRMATAARTQEIELRRLLQETDLSAADVLDTTRTDLAAMLDRHSSPSVTIATPAERVLVDAGVAAEVDQAVAEALTNVDRHAGPGAQAWVLLEREDAEVVVSIRDNGVGGTTAQLDEAFRRGRLGVRHSIRGRLADLGGVATVRTAPGRGLEWELRIPRRGSDG